MIDYTTIEESERLLALGLAAETADNHYDTSSGTPVGEAYAGEGTPCWSLGKLFSMLPILPLALVSCTYVGPTLAKSVSGKYSVRYEGVMYLPKPTWHPTPIEAVLAAYPWLLENGCIDTQAQTEK